MPSSTQFATGITVATVGSLVFLIGGFKINEYLKEKSFNETGIGSHKQLLQLGEDFRLANSVLDDFAKSKIKLLESEKQLLTQSLQITDVDSTIPDLKEKLNTNRQEALARVKALMEKEESTLTPAEKQARSALKKSWETYSYALQRAATCMHNCEVADYILKSAEVLTQSYASTLAQTKSWNPYTKKCKNALEKAIGMHTVSGKNFLGIVEAINISDSIAEVSKFQKFITANDADSIPASSANASPKTASA